MLLNENNKLKIDNEEYCIVVNYPKVLSANIPSHCMATFVIQPVVEMEFATHFTCIWSVDNGTSGHYVVVSEEIVYEPPISLVGRKLRVQITPVCGDRKGDSFDVCKYETIEAPVGETPISTRQNLIRMTSRQTNSQFRVVSYNILADCYVFTNWALTTSEYFSIFSTSLILAVN